MSKTKRGIPYDLHFRGVRAENSRGIFASEGPLFSGALFGRDSLEVAEDLIGIDEAIPREIIKAVAALQGQKYDQLSEEEPGKVHHEHRTRADAKTESSINIFETLSGMWGGNDQEFTYYGSVDATPLFVRLICMYVAEYGCSILDETVKCKNQERTIRDCFQKAYDWISTRIHSSPIGLIEYRRTNVLGIENQIWKDSPSAYATLSGIYLPLNNGIAAIEVQAYAYDAVKYARSIVQFDKNPIDLDEFRKRIIDVYWMENSQIFSSAISRTTNDDIIRLDTPLSNMGLILDSDILFDDPNQTPKAKLVVDRLLSDDFLASAGIRCRSLACKDIVGYPDYHGSYSVWFKETSDIARGFMRYGFFGQADKLRQTILSTLSELGEFYEFVFVDESGVVIHPQNHNGIFIDPRCNQPEPGQSWTISAFVKALHAESNRQ